VVLVEKLRSASMGDTIIRKHFTTKEIFNRTPICNSSGSQASCRLNKEKF